MSTTAVIEYQWKGYTPPDDTTAWAKQIQATISHATGVITSTGSQYLTDLRQELEEAGLRKVGACITNRRSGSSSQWLPKWREVWQHKDKVALAHQSQLSPRAQKARQESAARTRLYQSRKEKAEMGRYDHQVKDLAAKASHKHPELGDRPQKAAELVRKGHVRHKSGSRFVVTSQDGSREYFVDTESRTCTCRDYKWAPRVCKAPMCKHRLACLMIIKLNASISLAQPRAQGAALAVKAAQARIPILI